MSILIKGLKMPKDGKRLKVWIETNGQVVVDKRTYYEEYEAVELPDHGDLVDVDLLKAECKEPNVWWEEDGYERRCIAEI